MRHLTSITLALGSPRETQSYCTKCKANTTAELLSRARDEIANDSFQ
jgi:hypothetical protein